MKGSESNEMKKQNLRSLAIGMLLSACIIASFYLYQDNNKQEQNTLNVSNTTTYLQREGFTVLTEAEYTDLQTKLEESTQNQTKPNAGANKEEQEEPKEEKKETYSYTLKITSGMSISTIAELLFNENIVKDQEEFETYLIDNDYHTKIQVGSFRLTSDMSYKKIAETLTE